MKPDWGCRIRVGQAYVVMTPPPKFSTQPWNSHPLPDVVGKELEYEVEKIVNSWKQGCNIHYKVQWKGYSTHKQTWEPTSNVENSKDAVEEFHRLYPNKPKPITLHRIEIPISLFGISLLCPIPQPLTEPIPNPTCQEAHTQASSHMEMFTLKRG